MSYTTVKAVWPGKRTSDLEELPNSHGSAPVVWEAMAGRYLGVTKAYDYPGKGWMQLDNELWDLYKRKDIPLEHRAVFMLTFDRAYVEKRNYEAMAAAIRQFLMDFPPKLGHANHWPRLAELFESKPRPPAIGLYVTSVSEDPFLGPWNEKKDRYDKLDWKTAYELFDVLAAAERLIKKGDEE